jgi:RNA-directed DNA polymerase
MLLLGYIYKKDFFFKKVLFFDEESTNSVIQDKESFYSEFYIPKGNGVRKLSSIEKDSRLYKIQRNLKNNFLDNIPIPDNAKGFVTGSSYKDFLIPHINKKYFLRLDIKNFFENISSSLVKEVFNEYFKLDNSQDRDNLLNLFTELVTLNDSIPQGGVSSPSVSNIAFRRLDIRISRYCKINNIVFTRYADDLLFSSNNRILDSGIFIKKIYFILNDYKFQLNSKKIIKTKESISLNGFVIKDDIYLSRNKKKDLSKILFTVNTNKELNLHEIVSKINSSEFRNRKHKFKDFRNVIDYLAGQRSFLINYLPLQNDTNYYRKIQRIIINIESCINLLYDKYIKESINV